MMSFMDSLNSIFDIKLLGIPVIIIIAVLVFVIWLVWKYKPKTGRNRLNLEKAVKKDFDLMFRTFGETVGKSLNAGFVKVGHAIGSFPIYWDKNTSIKSRIRKVKYSKEQKAILKANKGDHIEDMTCFKMCGKGLLNRGLAVIGFKTYYMVVPTKVIDIGKNNISIPSSLQAQEFLGVMIYTKTARDYVENIAFKLNRQEELTEIADFIPKQNYLEIATAQVVAKAREKAQIEKEKYKGQIESAEDA